MLILTRKPGQSITIQPETGMDVTTPVEVLFTQGPIEFRVNRITRSGVNIGIAAHRQLHIRRQELSRLPGCSMDVPVYRTCRDILARNVFALRVQRKWSPEDLANYSQLAITTICALESGLGVIDLDDLDHLSLALTVNVATLLRE